MSDQPPSFPPPPPGPPPPSGPPAAPGGFSVGNAFSWGWKKFQENAATLVVWTLIVFVIAIAIYLVVSLIASALFLTDPTFDAETFELDEGSGFIARAFVSALASGLASIPLFFLQSNLIRGTLGIADGRKPEIGELFQFKDTGRTLTLALLIAAGTFVGTLLCYVPGILFGIGAAYSLYFFNDEDVAPVDAIKKSFSFVLSNLGVLILLILASAAAIFVGGLLCGIGLLVAIPVVSLANAFAFRSLNGGTITP